MINNHISECLKEMPALSASDLHMHSGLPASFRVHGLLRPRDNVVITDQMIVETLKSLLNSDELKHLMDVGEIDFSFGIPDLARFRGNAFRSQGKYSVVVRIIPADIPAFEALNLPEGIRRFTDLESGLVIITGPTGSGKSTTLASMLDLINQKVNKHILTLEDPIEFMHTNKQCLVTQREIGRDTGSFATGLRSSLREDPDVILIGEMRDLETTEIAIRAAETGHLVFATMHTPGVVETVDRILGNFQPHQRQQICAQLAMCLKGVMFQKLLPRKGGGRVAAMEVLVVNQAVRNLIREAKTHQIKSVMQTGLNLGMRTMERALGELYQQGLISVEIHDKFQELY